MIWAADENTFRQKRRAELAERIPGNVDWPADTATAFHILRCYLGFRIGTPSSPRAYFNICLRDGMQPPDTGENGRYQWTRADLLRTAMALDADRRWRPGCHDQKKTWAEREDEAAYWRALQNTGIETEACVRHLVHEMSELEGRQDSGSAMDRREEVSALIWAKLQGATGYVTRREAGLLERICNEPELAVRRALTETLITELGERANIG